MKGFQPPIEFTNKHDQVANLNNESRMWQDAMPLPSKIAAEYIRKRNACNSQSKNVLIKDIVIILHLTGSEAFVIVVRTSINQDNHTNYSGKQVTTSVSLDGMKCFTQNWQKIRDDVNKTK